MLKMKLILVFKIAVLKVLLRDLFCSGEKHGPESNYVKELVHSNNNFALKLLKLLSTKSEDSNDKENLFFSPTSISIALAMVFLGSRGNTATQMAEAFAWSDYEGEEIHSAFKTLHEAIHNSEHEVFDLKLANRIWGHNDFKLTYEFANAVKEFYGSEITLADFIKGSDKVRIDVNDWVHQQTNGKIRDFLAHGVLNPGTRLVLINAIYFKGAWKDEFDREKTFHAPFYAFGSREHKMEVNMMSKTSKQKYYFDQEFGCHILELPYSGEELSMILLLPEDLGGISRLEKSLTMENLDRWLTLLTKKTVSVALPRFKLSQQIDLKSVLPKLGIKDLFDGGKADLSGISENSGLFVSNVLHKADVEVNERGTEAAAATGVLIMKRSLDMNEVFHADHPFIFLIRHHLSGSVIFAGKLMEPSGLTEHEDDHTKRSVADEL